MQTIALVLSLAMAITSCKKTAIETIIEDTKPRSAETLSNVSYGSDARQKMDIYLPANRNSEETVLAILIHGGGWSSGDKSDLAPYVNELKQRLPEYAFANINYKLVTNTQNKFPTQENDVKAAINYLLSNAKQYKYSQKIVLIGVSAGAHLALLQGYKYTDQVKPVAIISFFGPADLIDMYNNPINSSMPLLLQSLTGYSVNQNRAAYESSSPITFVNTQSSPTLLLHGDKDNLVPIGQARLLKEKLESVNVPHKLVVYNNEGHGWVGEKLEDSFNKITDFLKEHDQ